MKSDIVAAACDLISLGKQADAAALISSDYPFVPEAAVERRYGEAEALRVFLRDGFIDRYSGDRLVFPGALRVLSEYLPGVFPFHPNWKMSETHIAYWQLSPTVDHVFPAARGGADDEANWVTTSMLRNSAKGNWTLEELGWIVVPAGDLHEWDGLLGWFRKQLTHRPEFMNIPLVRRWNRAATTVLNAGG